MRQTQTPAAGRTRRRLATIGAGVLVVALVPSLALASSHLASLPGSSFEIDTDANFVNDEGGTWKDWVDVNESRREDAPTGRDDDSYQGGVKEDTVCPTSTTGSIPNNKSDLRFFGVYEEEGDPGYLNLFWTRVAEPSGTTLMDFEFNQSSTGCPSGPNVERTEGDFLIEYSIDQGGARADITIREWTGTAWGPADALDQTEATGTINQTEIAAADSDGTLPEGATAEARTFGEASIDLSVIFDEGKCESFGSAMLKSRASDSFTSQVKDYIAPVPIELTNCGKVIIHKETDPPGADEDFGYTKAFATDMNPDPTPEPGDTFTLNASDPSTATIEFDGVLFGEDYTVTEDTLPTGWDFDDVDCSASEGVQPVIVGPLVTFDIDDEGDVLECTYYNKARASLTVVKEVNDPPGGQGFDFTSNTLTSPFTLTPTATGAAGADEEEFSNLVPGSYDVAETVPNNWNLTSASCDNGDDPGSITLDAGEDVTCTFVNERERGAIEITKTRKHAAAAGGEGPHAGVTFTITGGDLPADGVTATTDANGVACVDGLLDGSYNVAETTVPTGYAAVDDQTVNVTDESECGDGNEATVSFVNTPLTDVTVSVDSLVDGGTASTISCVDAEGTVVGEDLDNEPGDVELALPNLEPTAPDDTLVCTIVVDP